MQRWLKARYAGLLRWVTCWPWVALSTVVVGCLLAVNCLPSAGGEFLPDFKEGYFVLQVFATPGTSLPEMLRIGGRVSQEVLKIQGVATVEQQVGRAELGEDPWPPSRSEFHVELNTLDGEAQERIAREIRATLARFPGLQSEVLTFLGDRIGETLTGETAPVVINIFGEDLDVLDAKAREVAAVLNTVVGHADVKTRPSTGTPRLSIRLRPERLAQFGFRPVEVLEAVQTAYEGMIVSQVHQGSLTTDVAAILPPEERSAPELVGRLWLVSSSGERVPLSELAEIYPSSGRSSISHEGARRRQTVTCAAEGRDVAGFVRDAQQQIAARVVFPAGTYCVFTGAAQAKEKAQRELFIHSVIAGVGILLLLGVAFHNLRNLALVLINVPFALVGGVLAVWASSLLAPEDSALTIGSLVGFVTLFGITMRNSIMMISHFEHLVQVEGLRWGPETAVRGAAERLMPILMTATVTGLGLLPLAIGAGDAGREIEGPMAWVILGGLITSTALNLLVLPVLSLRFGRFERTAGEVPTAQD